MDIREQLVVSAIEDLLIMDQLRMFLVLLYAQFFISIFKLTCGSLRLPDIFLRLLWI